MIATDLVAQGGTGGAVPFQQPVLELYSRGVGPVCGEPDLDLAAVRRIGVVPPNRR